MTSVGFASRLVNGILAIKPLADFAKHQAREMMINRAEDLGVPWRANVSKLRERNWEDELAQIQDSQLTYPDYYLCSFHAYEQGNLNWDAALEVEFASYAVHAKTWENGGREGDAMLRQSYHDCLTPQLPQPPEKIVDIGCGVGMSTMTLQDIYPQAEITGVDLSPYFLTVAQYRTEKQNRQITWKHAAAEATGLTESSCDLVSACLMFHELPQTASREIISEARRLLRPGGYLAIMDMNPNSEVFLKMPPYILTLLKSTEPYLDQYFSLDINSAIVENGFANPTITINSPRHRTIIAQAV